MGMLLSVYLSLHFLHVMIKFAYMRKKHLHYYYYYYCGHFFNKTSDFRYFV